VFRHEQITQGKVHDYFDTSKVYFTMPNIIFRIRTMSCELAPSLCCVGLFCIFH
jgi:hypothetical protein